MSFFAVKTRYRDIVRSWKGWLQMWAATYNIPIMRVRRNLREGMGCIVSAIFVGVVVAAGLVGFAKLMMFVRQAQVERYFE